MNRRFRNTALALVLFTPLAVWAHDPRLHQANAVTGQVMSVADSSFELKTKTDNWKVTFSKTTQFEHGKQKVDKTHLKKGETVGVIGTKLPNGELVAKQVLLDVEEEAGHDAAKKPATDHKH